MQKSYKEAVTECYYVDKTLFIKDILDDHSKAYLFTRPRRFGKTLMMDMVKTFFENTEDMEEVITLPTDYFQELYAEGASMAGFQPGEKSLAGRLDIPKRQDYVWQVWRKCMARNIFW